MAQRWIVTVALALTACGDGDKASPDDDTAGSPVDSADTADAMDTADTAGVASADWPEPERVQAYLIGEVEGAGGAELYACEAVEDYAAEACELWAGGEVRLSADATPEAPYVLALRALSGAGLPLLPGAGTEDGWRMFGVDTPLATVAEPLGLSMSVQVGPLEDASTLGVWWLASSPPPEGGKFPVDLRWEAAEATLDEATGVFSVDVDAPGVWAVAAPRSGAPADTAPAVSAEVGSQELWFPWGGRLRRAELLVQETGAPMPLVVVLHGSGQDSAVPDQWGWSQLAEREGFHLLLGEGTWAGDEPLGGSFLWTGRLDYDDGLNPGYRENLGYLEALLDAAEAALPIEPGHVFVSGFSGGGILTHRAGAELAHRIDGVAPVAALGIGEEEDYPHPPPDEGTVSVITVMGLEDSAHPYEGEDDKPGALEGAEAWAARFGCDPEPLVEDSGAVSRHTWACDDGDAVVLISVADGVHDYDMLAPHGIATAEAVYDFFLAHPE